MARFAARLRIGREVAMEIERKERRSSRKVVIRALKKTTKSISEQPNTKLVYAEDQTFGVMIVYAYSDFKTYRKLSNLLFKNPKPSEFPANGFAAFGPSIDEIDKMLCLVWVSNRQPLNETLPVFVHEISHLSQDMLDHAGVQDKSGEVQAYTIERETVRVMREMLGMKVSRSPSIKKVKEIVDGKSAEVRPCPEDGRPGDKDQ